MQRHIVATCLATLAVISAGLIGSAEIGPDEPPVIVSGHVFDGVTRTNIAEELPRQSLHHPLVGEFNLSMHRDFSPVVGKDIFRNAQGELVEDTPEEFILSANAGSFSGRLSVGNRSVAGYLWLGDADLIFDGTWQEGGLALELTGANPAYSDLPEHAPHDDGVEANGGDSWAATTHNHCNPAESADQDKADCADANTLFLDVPVGDDQEDSVNLPTTSSDVQIPVYVFTQGRNSEAATDCMIASDRIYEEEVNIPLVCERFDTGTAHEISGNDGEDDWYNFLQSYFAGGSGYMTRADNFNNGRLVLFLPDEGNIGGAAGWGVGCNDHLWVNDASVDQDRPCGHGAVYNKASSSSYKRHSSSYREAQTFAHEILHMLSVDAAPGDRSSQHDSTVVGKDYNGKEGCSNGEIDFWSHNVYFWTSSGGDCDHRHFWLTTSTEQTANNNAIDVWTVYWSGADEALLP